MTHALAVLAQQRWDHPMHGWDGGWMWLWGTLMMLSWAGIVAAAVWLVVRASRRDREGDGSAGHEAVASSVTGRLARRHSG